MAQKATYTATIAIPPGGSYPFLIRIYWDATTEQMFSFVPPISTDPSLTIDVVAALNAANIGVWHASNDGNLLTIWTDNNSRKFTIISVSDGTDATFVESNVVLLDPIYGCTNPAAINYDPDATEDNGSCLFNTATTGCTDPTATNYNPNASVDDGSCVYPLDDVGKIRCCYATTAQQIAERQMNGEPIPCGLSRKLQYIEGVLYAISQYKPIGEIIGYTSELTGTITENPVYFSNVSSSSAMFRSVWLYSYTGQKTSASDQLSLPATATIKIYLENPDGTVDKEIGSLTRVFVDIVDIEFHFNELFNNRDNPNNPDGMNEILSGYTSTYDVVRTLVKVNPPSAIPVPNNLRDGVNNTGAFFNGRRIRASISIALTDVCDYVGSFFADANDGDIPCDGTPLPGLVTFSSTCSGTLTITSSQLTTASGISYQWQSSPDDSTWTDMTGETSVSLTITPDGSTYYRLKSYCIYGAGENFSNSVLPEYSPPPIPVAGSGGDVCLGSDIFLSADNVASGQSSGNTYSWVCDNGFTSDQQYPSIPYGSPYYPAVGTGITATVTVTNMYGCSASDSTSLNVNDNPTIVVDTVGTDNITVHTVGGLAPYGYTVDFINFNSDGIFTGLTPGVYTVYVSDGNGCQDTSPLLNIPASNVYVLADGVDTLVVSNINGTAPFVFTLMDTNRNILTVNTSGGMYDTNPSSPKADLASTSWYQMSGYSYIVPPKNVIVQMKDANNVINEITYTIP